MVVGEFSRSDCIDDIYDIKEIEQGEPGEMEHYVKIK
jgi:hypothetical protein